MSTTDNNNSNGSLIQYPNHDFETAERIHSMAVINEQTPYDSELLAIRLLRENKIYAIPGKLSGWYYTDLVAFGLVRIETKISMGAKSRGENVFQWRLKSRKTEEKGLRGEIVMLLADDGENTEAALFPVDHPIFYNGNRLKHGLTYRRNKQYHHREGTYGMTLNDEIWNAHKDNYSLVWEVFYKNIQKL